MGTPKAAVPSLERLIVDGHEVCAVYSQPDRPSGRGNKITFSPVKEYALQREIPVYQPAKIRTVDAVDDFRAHSADVAVVVAYGRILPETFLTAFPQGAINVHFSLLPKYRGAAPVNWAIVNGEAATGVTTMQMDVGLDTGDMLLQCETAIGSDENAIELMERLAAIGAELLSETLNNLKNLQPKKQDESAATFAPIMKREDGLIDWRMSARDIANRVRGFQPFPTSFTFIGEAKLTIWQATPGEPGPNITPGTILTALGDKFEVACGGGTIMKIEEVQPEGKRRMPVRDFLNGARPQMGMILGK